MQNTRMSQIISVAFLAIGSTFTLAQQAAAPADGITMDMMPITQDQLTACRSQASSQLTDEQKTLHDREHGQDKDKMAQGAVTGVSGLASTIASRRGGWWGNNNGAGVAAATGGTQRTERNSQAVASTTATSQTVGVDAYQQCVNGIKGPEYIRFRQTGQMGGIAAASAAAAPAATAAVSTVAAAAIGAPVPNPTKSPVQDEGDGKHFILTAPGQTDAREVMLMPGSKNRYVEEATGDKYIVMPDGGVTRLPGTKRAAK